MWFERRRAKWLALALSALLFKCYATWPIAARAADPPDRRGQSWRLTGRVVDAVGSAIGDVAIKIYRYESERQRFGSVFAEMRSGHDGAYSFEIDSSGFFALSAEKSGFARAFCDITIGDVAPLPVTVVLKRAASVVIRVQDVDGHPIAGAQIREFWQRGENGQFRFWQLWRADLGLELRASDGAGRLEIPALPVGDIVFRIAVDHADFAPVRVENLKVVPGATTNATMQRGVTLTLHVAMRERGEPLRNAVIDLRHEPSDHPSTNVYREIAFDLNGDGRLTIAPGDYDTLQLKHEKFLFSPSHFSSVYRKDWLRIEPGRNDHLTFEANRKVSVRGRVVDAVRGQAVPDALVRGDVACGETRGWTDPPRKKWGFAGTAKTNERGEYTISLAAGRARVTFEGNKFLSEHETYEFTVASDGSSVVPDIRVRPIPKIVGEVQDAHGRPAPRVVVRVRGRFLTEHQPILTDASGRFEIQPEFVPRDEETGNVVVAHVVAFDPFSPLAARADVHLHEPGALSLKLQQHDLNWLFSEFTDEMVDWERGIVPVDEEERKLSISLRGQIPPELDAALWLNSNSRALKLSELRGKYVLLNFWFTGCGPCHHDFPSVKLVHDLYKDKGVVVIAVHNNSGTPEAVRKHVAEIRLPFPVAVDHADGRMIARFEPHGIPDGYPDYVLISPEGKVLLDDRTIPGPSLRSYKLEIIRKHLLAEQLKAR